MSQDSEIEKQLKTIIVQLNAMNIQVEDMKNSIMAKDHKLEELTKLVRDMCTKQDLVLITDMNEQKVKIKSSSTSKAATKSDTSTGTGRFKNIKTTNVREFFKTLFVENRDVFMKREHDNEYKEEYGISQNGFLTQEFIDIIFEKEKKIINAKKTKEKQDNSLANKIYSALAKDDTRKDDVEVVRSMRTEFLNFVKKENIENLTKEDPSPSSEPVDDDEPNEEKTVESE